MKDIVPIRITFELNPNGTSRDSILFYKILFPSGNVSRKTYSISIKTEVSVPVINGIIFRSKALAKIQENKGV